jgi:predicted DNA-binding transcriptional regulator YafY
MQCKKETKRAEKKRYRNRKKGNQTTYQFRNESQKSNLSESTTSKNQLANSKLNMAIKLGEKSIEIKYKDKRGRITKRKIHIFGANNTHLTGHCFKANDRRTFSRSGILELKRLEFE